MLHIRHGNERGRAKLGWLDSRHSFSFGHYYDPQHMGFGLLRVINDDRVAPGSGFETHGHRDMEIITYVVDGALEHKDNMGNGSIIRPGEVQCMSAGTGIMHREFNHSKSKGLRFMQIWILPKAQGLQPSYEQKAFEAGANRGGSRLLVSPDGAEGSLHVNQNIRLFDGQLHGNESFTQNLKKGTMAWVQMIDGRMTLNHQPLSEGDGAALKNETTLQFEKGHKARFLLFELPGEVT